MFKNKKLKITAKTIKKERKEERKWDTGRKAEEEEVSFSPGEASKLEITVLAVLHTIQSRCAL